MSEVQAFSESQQLAIGKNISYIRWALSHAAVLNSLVSAFQKIASAEGIAAKWSAVKDFGDVVVSMADDFPTSQMLTVDHGPLSADEIEAMVAVHAQAIGDGELFRKGFRFFVDHLPQIIAAVRVVMGLVI